ncbi:MAG: hypothetical protein K2L14_01965 [Duncaniella sp.]|nr:hypothetical protein [Duncaniella sp.]
MKYLLITLTSLLMLTGCGWIGDSDECPVTDNSTISLSFNMMTSGPILSRTDADPAHREVDSEYREFEDGIDISDLAVFIFAKITGSAEPERLVYKLTDLTKSDDARIKVLMLSGSYQVDIMIFRDDLMEILGGYEITPEGQENISFRMLVMANCSSPGTNAAAKWNAIDGKDYTKVIEQLDTWDFAMGYIYNPDGTGDVTSLYQNKKKHVPMFGTYMFPPVSEDALYYSRPENRVYLGEMDLLRALAKVRVVDNIPGKVDGFPRISSVEFVSSQSEAHQLPYDAAKYVNGQQVHDPAIAHPENSLTPENPIIYRLGTLPAAWCMTPPDERKGEVFIGFVPEQQISIVNNVLDSGMPMFRITIDVMKADGELETLTYDVPMTRYNGKTFNFGANILRNHIYTLSVDGFGTELDLHVDLVPYRSCVLEPFFGLDRD